MLAINYLDNLINSHTLHYCFPCFNIKPANSTSVINRIIDLLLDQIFLPTSNLTQLLTSLCTATNCLSRTLCVSAYCNNAIYVTPLTYPSVPSNPSFSVYPLLYTIFPITHHFKQHSKSRLPPGLILPTSVNI